MPTFIIVFIKTMEVQVEADSVDEARAAAEWTIRDVGIDDAAWNAPDWEVDNVWEVHVIDPSILMGIGDDSNLCHIVDAVPSEGRRTFYCKHGTSVDIVGRGCAVCDSEAE